MYIKKQGLITQIKQKDVFEEVMKPYMKHLLHGLHSVHGNFSAMNAAGFLTMG